MSSRIADLPGLDDFDNVAGTGTSSDCHSERFPTLARRRLPVEPLVLLALFGTVTPASSYQPADDFGTFSHTTQRALTAPVSYRGQSAGVHDVLLDSPNWLESKIARLAARGFHRVNDPRARR